VTKTPNAAPKYAGSPKCDAEAASTAELYESTLIAEVHRRVVFLRNVDIDQRDDVAQMTIEAFLRNADTIAARYPEPGVWVSLKLAAMAIDAQRRNDAQRGAGARHTRQVDAFDPNDPSTHAILIEDADPIAHFLLDEQLAPLLNILTPEDRYLFCMVNGFGYSAREVADALGIADSTASKRLKRIRRDLHEFAVAA
jgi:RNA polymerase sigma factor (sigma-70 family)